MPAGPRSWGGCWASFTASLPRTRVKKAGHTHQVAKTGAVTLIQRFGSALNLNVHFHMLFLDGVYVEQSHGSARFRWVKAPTSPELTQLTHTIAHRVGRYLERQGLLERDVENSYLASDAVDDDPMTPLLGHSITYRIAVGSQAGRKVFTLQTLPTSGDPFGDGIGKVAGSSLHAGVAARADERKKLERLCRYISRPAVSEKRLSLTRGGNVRYQLKTPYRDGTTHVIFEPLDFIARLAAPGTEAQSQPNPLPRGVRTQQSAPGVGHAGKNGAGATRSGWLMNRQHQHNGERR
nr:hypothetical protein [Escherichia coli]